MNRKINGDSTIDSRITIDFIHHWSLKTDEGLKVPLTKFNSDSTIVESLFILFINETYIETD